MSLSDKEDLEDGEIEDDDDDTPIIVEPPKQPEPKKNLTPVKQPAVIEKRSDSVEDDWAINVEKAIANALIKDGVEPPLPKISNKEHVEEPPLPKSRRRRKPKSERTKNKTHSKDNAESDTVLGRVQIFNQKKQDENKEDDEYPDDFEMLNVRGGSPPPQTLPLPPITIDDSCDSNKGSSGEDSYDSEEYKRMSYEERRQKRREQNKQSRKDRDERDRDRDDRKRDRDRDRDRRERDRNDRDEDHYERREPRKMEICKFYLLDCCAKRDKCSYLHSEFPCKYYYLGMKCPHKDCKFNHGKLLTDQFRGILLKHLETAPKEILGDFPRIGRERALKLMDATHLKLLAKERGDKMPAFEMCEGTYSNTPNIPSLLDAVLPKPGSKSDKPRRTRWHDLAVPPAPTLPDLKETEEKNKPVMPEYMSIQNMTGILTQKQIDDLLEMGIEYVEQIKQLTLMQMDGLGLTIAQITDMQKNVQTLEKLSKDKENVNTIKSPDPRMDSLHASEPAQDLDLRIPPVLDPNTVKQQSVVSLESSQDIDMRMLPTTVSSLTSGLSNVPITSSAALQALDHKKDEASSKPIEQKPTEYSSFYANSSSSSLAPPVVDYSQYLKDAQMKDADSDENQKENLVIANDESAQDEDSELQIDESWYDSDDELEKVTTAEVKIDIQKPEQSNTFMSPVHTQESIIASLKELEKEKQKEQTETRTDPRLLPPTIASAYTPALGTAALFESFYDKPKTETIPKEPVRDPRKRRLPSNDIKSPSQSDSADDDLPKRLSIYDRDSDEEDYEPKAKKTDKDMRLAPIMLDGDSLTGDIDLRLPFKPIMASYIPATEIDASFASHPLIAYKLFEVDIPKPNFRELRNSKNISIMDKVTDPRLSRLLGMRNNRRDSRSSSDYEVNRPPTIASPDPVPVKQPQPAIRVDPRRRKEELSQPISTTNSSSPSSNTNTIQPKEANQLDMQGLMVLLQRSGWYQDLSSNNKIMVNQQLANLSAEMKKFNQDPSTDKVFDVTYVTSNPFLQHILTNLGVYLNENGYFCHVDDSPKNAPILPNLSQPPPGQPPGLVLPPNIDLALLNNLRPLLNQARHPLLQARPSLLGPPPLLQNPIFDENVLNAIRGILPQGGPNFPPPILNDFNRGQGNRQQDRRRNFGGNMRNDNRRNNDYGNQRR